MRRGRIEPTVIAGDTPSFGAAWHHIAQLRRIAPLVNMPGASDTGAGAPSIALRRADRGAEAMRAVESPGVYEADSRTGALKLAVNVDAAAGDTRGVEAQRVPRMVASFGRRFPVG